MASRAATKRLLREYQTIQQNPPPFIIAHPSDSNILEWHYILTGPPDTPYANGQYWGSLMFPTDYPFAPPAIRMHTPSGRFQPSARLCLSISDFHPKSFNPAWEVSTILIGLLSFMTSDEMTTGSMSASGTERRFLAAQSRWWNSTGAGSNQKATPGVTPSTRGINNINLGDGGLKFRTEWPELDQENWKWMEENGIDLATGKLLSPPKSSTGANSTSSSNGTGAANNNAASTSTNNCSPETSALRRQLAEGSATGLNAVMDGGRSARFAGQSWLLQHKMLVGAGLVFLYAILVRMFEGVGIQ